METAFEKKDAETQPQKSYSKKTADFRASGMWELFIALAALIAVFFIFTDGIPLIQLGILAEKWGTKKHLLALTRSVVALFFLLLGVLYRIRPGTFRSLRLIRFFSVIDDRRAVSALFLLYAAILTGVGFMRHAALETRAFDLGIFAQAVWNTANGSFLYSSLKGGICLLGDHVSPILALLAPFYFLWPDPRTLLILQALAAASCLFPLRVLAKEKTNDSFVTFIFCLAYFFYLPTRNVLHEDFHPEVLVEPFIFLAFLFLERRQITRFLLCVLLMVSAKENMLLIAFALGFYAFLFKGLPRLGTFLMISSAALFWFETQRLVPWLSRAPYLYQGSYRHLLAHFPLGLAAPLLHPQSWEYLFKVFSPLLFLSFFHLPALLLTCPILMQNLLSENEVYRSIGYHYTTGLTPFIFISAVYGLTSIARKFEKFGNLKRLLAVLLIFASILRAAPSEYYYFWQSLSHRSPERDLIRKKLSQIPGKYSVLTHNNLIPQLCNRRNVYQFDYRPRPSKSESARELDADYVILAQEFWEENTLPFPETMKQLADLGYRPEFYAGPFAILKKAGGS